jgi:hypothetical protein
MQVDKTKESCGELCMTTHSNSAKTPVRGMHVPESMNECLQEKYTAQHCGQTSPVVLCWMMLIINFWHTHTQLLTQNLKFTPNHTWPNQ